MTPRRASWLATGLLLAGSVAVAAQATTTTTRSIKVAGVERSYLLHVPATLPHDRPSALVLVFHGGGGTPAWAERESRFSELAEREGFIVAYPEGLGKSWNDGRDDPGIRAQRDAVDDLSFIKALLDEIGRTYRIDSSRVFATGISNGGMFSQFLATRLSDRIAAVAPVAAGLPAPLAEGFRPAKPVSVLMINGTEDPLVHYEGGSITLPWGADRGAIVSTDAAIRLWVEHNRCSRTPVTAELPDQDPRDRTRIRTLRYGPCRDGTAVVLYRIDGGGHTWPGGMQYLPRFIIGNLSRDIDATEVIWEFFERHPRP